MSGTFTQKDLMAFSPVDMTVYMGGRPIRSVLQLQYAVEREVIGLYGFGDANAVGFNRGKRGIVGSLVCNTFQDHPLLRSDWAQQSGIYDPSGTPTLGAFGASSNDKFKATLDDFAFNNGTFKIGTAPDFGGGTFSLADPDLRSQLDDTYKWVANKKLNYVDQLPPMDITITCVNEQGNAAYMSLNSVILMGESGMMSMESLTSELHFKFLARSITPLRAFTTGSGSKQPSTVQFSTVAVAGQTGGLSNGG